MASGRRHPAPKAGFAGGYVGPEHVTVGVEQDSSLREIVALIVELTRYGDVVRRDEFEPDGQPRRTLNSSQTLESSDLGATTLSQDNVRVTIARCVEAYDRWD